MNIDLKSDELPDIIGGFLHVVDPIALPVKKAFKGKGNVLLSIKSNRINRQPPYVVELLQDPFPFAFFRYKLSCRIRRLLVLWQNQAT